MAARHHYLTERLFVLRTIEDSKRAGRSITHDFKGNVIAVGHPDKRLANAVDPTQPPDQMKDARVALQPLARR